MTAADQGRRSFADKLSYLIETVHPPDRGSYSYREIAAGIADHPGAMTAAHINQLAIGKQPRPRIHHVARLQGVTPRHVGKLPWVCCGWPAVCA